MLGRFDRQETEKSQEDITAGFHLLKESGQMVNVLDKMRKSAEKHLYADMAQQAVGLLVLTEAGKLAGVAVSDQKKQSYFYYAGTGSALVENRQLSLFDEMQETVEDTALLQAVRQLTAVCPVYTLDIKKQYGFYGWEQREEDGLTRQYFDTIIGAYLLNPLKSDYDGEAVATEHLELSIPGYKECFGKRTWRRPRRKTWSSWQSFTSTRHMWLCRPDRLYSGSWHRPVWGS